MKEFLDQSTDWGDLSMVNDMFHEDFMYLRETEMLTRQEFIAYTEDDFASCKLQSSDRKILYENNNVVS